MSTERAIAHQIAPTQAGTRLRPAAPVELTAIVLLALSTLVAVTAVSIGIARAAVPGHERIAISD
jgi:hypothetical protein